MKPGMSPVSTINIFTSFLRFLVILPNSASSLIHWHERCSNTKSSCGGLWNKKALNKLLKLNVSVLDTLSDTPCLFYNITVQDTGLITSVTFHLIHRFCMCWIRWLNRLVKANGWVLQRSTGDCYWICRKHFYLEFEVSSLPSLSCAASRYHMHEHTSDLLLVTSEYLLHSGFQTVTLEQLEPCTLSGTKASWILPPYILNEGHKRRTRNDSMRYTLCAGDLIINWWNFSLLLPIQFWTVSYNFKTYQITHC